MDKIYKKHIYEKGYATIDNVFTAEQINAILAKIEEADPSKETFRKSEDLFAIRQFLKEVPDVAEVIFRPKLNAIIEEIFGEGYFAVKSIYFDKPEKSNWYVSYHQDLTISVNKKTDLPGFGPWTVKQNQFAVQPPLSILENNFTIRIHLDETTEYNGALKVVPGSHLKGIYRPESIDWSVEKEETCDVPLGGIMIMKPLLLHSSGRTINQQKRRVIHIEFSKVDLPEPLEWSERMG